MADLFIPGIAFTGETRAPAWWFAFSGNHLLVHPADHPLGVPHLPSLEDLGLTPVRTQFLGWLGKQPCFSAQLPLQITPPPGMALKGLRNLYGVLDEAAFSLAGLGFQVMEWDRTHQFCGTCGQPTEAASHERAKRCSACSLSYYPRVSPAMIVLISRGDDILLARAPRFKPGMYGLIAGYVEPGESLESTVVREVKEEVGIAIKDLRYWGSQPWPFPHCLMVGYTATYDSGDIVIDGQELVDAAWFHKDHLPLLPPPVSIARKMIDWFVSSKL